MDELAEKLGIDPLEFRLKNAAKEGHAEGRAAQPAARIGDVECVQAAMTSPH